MIAPVSKRRKIEHQSSVEEDENASFASFDSEDENGALKDVEDIDSTEDLNGADEGSSDEIEEQHKDEDDNPSDNDEGVLQAERRYEAIPKDQPTRSARQRLSSGVSTATGTSQSNTFAIQVDELLKQIRPRRRKKEIAMEDALHKLKTTIEKIPHRAALSVDEAERQLLMSSKVATPFPKPRPPKDAKYKLAYQKPASMNVVGSHSLKTLSRARGSLDVDMTLEMPASLFQEKDYLNHRYFYKRAYYIACIAAGLQNNHAKEFHIRFQRAHDNALKPILIVRPAVHDDEVNGTKHSSSWQINILPCIATDIFDSGKLLPSKNCVRLSTTSRMNENSTNEEQLPTPFYNSSLRSDMLMTSYLKLLHATSKRCEGFQDACLLGSTWLRQRGFGSNIHTGGFGNFEFSALMALLLEQGKQSGRSVLNENYSIYQLFKATLQLMSVKDLSKDALVLGQDKIPFKPASDGSPIVWDGTRNHNLLFKMTPWSYNFLRHEAKTSLNTLGDSRSDGFEATFILRTDSPLYRYDYILQIDSTLIKRNPEQSRVLSGEEHHLYDTLQRALGDRVRLLNIIPQWSETWDINSTASGRHSERKLLIGFIANPDTIHRMIDHGPPAESKSKAAAFRDFWGDRAELRRFKDGSILETLVWPAKPDGQTVFEEIIRFVIKKHIGDAAEQNIVLTGDVFRSLLAQTASVAAFHPLMESYKELESDIRGLDSLPLSLRQLLPADAQLRFASETIPKAGQQQTPADVVVQFEGSSRWPDDLVAIQRTKTAFLLNMRDQLEESSDTITARVGLENEQHDILNQAFLDINYESGARFRLRIHHDREQTLLERKLQDKSLDPRVRDVAALGLAQYKRNYLKAPAFTQAIGRLCSRYAAMSGTIRLTKKWFACHLLANHIVDEVIEMLVARTFVQPWPWSTPSSVQTAFLRTLFWISRWDWRAEPLIVDLSGSDELKQAEAQATRTKFEAWRKLDPALNRMVLFCASNADLDGTTWTDGKPSKVVAGRMTSLARAACAEIEDKQLWLEPGSLFSSPTSDFDFVLHLNTSVVNRGRRRKGRESNGITFKNLELDVQDDADRDECRPMDDFLHDLEKLYGSAMLLFSGGQDRHVIVGLWTPQTSTKAWKVNLTYSTVPKRGHGEDVQAEINKEGILAEIARLGGDMIERIEVHGK